MIQIKSEWGQKVVVKLIQWWIKRKYGYKVRINVREFNLVEIGDDVTVTVNTEIKMKKDDLDKVISRIGE